MTDEKVIKAAVNVLMKPILDLLQDDPHMWSMRPCSTCRAISSMVGKPFGCYFYAQKMREQKCKKEDSNG